MKNIIRIVILLLLCSVNLLAQNGTVTIKSLTADFKQTKTMKMLGSSMVSTGKMCYASPDKLRWEYTTPYACTLVMNGQKVMFKRNGRKDVMDTQKNKMFREIGRVMLGSVVVSSKQKRWRCRCPSSCVHCIRALRCTSTTPHTLWSASS